jgi:hypothetical protein
MKTTIEMAREADIDWHRHWDDEGNRLERFAELVRADEREECAEVCKKHADVYAGLEQNSTTQSAWAACIDNHDAIRARGQA